MFRPHQARPKQVIFIVAIIVLVGLALLQLESWITYLIGGPYMIQHERTVYNLPVSNLYLRLVRSRAYSSRSTYRKARSTQTRYLKVQNINYVVASILAFLRTRIHSTSHSHLACDTQSMASLGHPRPSVTASRQSRVPIALPPYEVPTNPLNQKAQNALHDLPRDHSLGSLKARMKAANAHLSHAAADINDRLQAKVEREEKGKRRREALSSPGSTDPGDEALEQMRQETEEMTVNLDQKIRDVIDSRAKIDGVEKILKELDSNVAANRGNLAPTQSTLGASQFRGPKRRLIASESDEEPDEDDSQLSMEGNGPILVLKRRIAEHDHAYHAESLTARYSAHNDYIGFKNLVHDARHPGDNAPPVPHSSTWFPSEIRGTQSSASAGPGGTQHTDDDEDLRVASERISIKCPITLRPMRNPVSSKNCVHNFEKEAILEMINVSDIRVGGEKAMKCPVCEVVSPDHSIMN